jgi:hypothetical protein
MLQYHNEKIPASDPIPIRLSDAKLRQIQPELYGPQSATVEMQRGKRILNAGQVRMMISEHLSFGDSRAAVVIFGNPLLVAAYTDEQDAVVLLRFPQFLAGQYQLTEGGRLLTVNTYGKGKRMAADILPGPAAISRWTNFYPLVAEFLSDDLDVIERRKAAISQREWQRATQFGEAAVALPSPRVRDGRPMFSQREGICIG